MLKDASAIWKKVYVKKDLHPVYVAENTRLHKEYYKLKGKTEYKDKVTFSNGKLSIDNLVKILFSRKSRQLVKNGHKNTSLEYKWCSNEIFK